MTIFDWFTEDEWAALLTADVGIGGLTKEIVEEDVKKLAPLSLRLTKLHLNKGMSIYQAVERTSAKMGVLSCINLALRSKEKM